VRFFLLIKFDSWNQILHKIFPQKDPRPQTHSISKFTSQLDIVNSADSAFFILKLVSLVSLNPHSIFILVAFSSLLHLYPRCIYIPVES